MNTHHQNIKEITVVGTGVIGVGWIARFLANGYRVKAFDPTENAEEKTKQRLDEIWPTLEQIGLNQGASRDHLIFEDDLKQAVQNADYIQENVPEREELKQNILADIDCYAKPDAIIASSTSGYKPSTLQSFCNHIPERVIVAHPFNPVYLIPLVELVGGQETSKKYINKAYNLLQSMGMKPLVLSHEIEGHLSDRLMEAVWREALHLVNDGVATTEEIDASIVYGPGLRWALMGPFLTLKLAGGEQGMGHMLDQFGPALKLPWTKLVAPELTEDLANKVIDGCTEQTKNHSIHELEQRRDQFLIELLELVEKYWPAANLNAQQKSK